MMPLDLSGSLRWMRFWSSREPGFFSETKALGGLFYGKKKPFRVEGLGK